MRGLSVIINPVLAFSEEEGWTSLGRPRMWEMECGVYLDWARGDYLELEASPAWRLVEAGTPDEGGEREVEGEGRKGVHPLYVWSNARLCCD